MAENALPDSTEQRSEIGAGDRCRLIVAGPAQGFADSLVPQFGSTAICGPNIREDFAKTHWPIVVKAKMDLSPSEVATHLRDIAGTLVSSTSWLDETMTTETKLLDQKFGPFDGRMWAQWRVQGAEEHVLGELLSELIKYHGVPITDVVEQLRAECQCKRCGADILANYGTHNGLCKTDLWRCPYLC